MACSLRHWGQVRTPTDLSGGLSTRILFIVQVAFTIRSRQVAQNVCKQGSTFGSLKVSRHTVQFSWLLAQVAMTIALIRRSLAFWSRSIGHQTKIFCRAPPTLFYGPGARPIVSSLVPRPFRCGRGEKERESCGCTWVGLAYKTRMRLSLRLSNGSCHHSQRNCK